MTPAIVPKSRALCTWIPCWASLALFFGILSMAAHIRLGLGHWPTPMTENYQTESYSYHEKVVGLIGIIALYVAGPLWAIFVAIPWFRLTPKKHLIQLSIFVAGFLLIFLAGKFDPTTFTEWLLD